MSWSPTEDELDEIQEAFDFVAGADDDAVTNSVPADKLGDLMRALGMNPSADQLAQLTSGPFSGGVNVGPFTDHLKGHRGEYLDNVDEILEAFRVFDKDNTDMVSKKQLMKTMTTMGDSLEMAEVKAFFAGVEAGCGDSDQMEYKAVVQQMMDK